MNNTNDSRYDTKTGSYDAGWNIVDQFLNGGKSVTEIRDNQTGEVYKGVGETDQQSRDAAWDSVRRS
jgi:hypothetical protein